MGEFGYTPRVGVYASYTPSGGANRVDAYTLVNILHI